MPNCYICNRGTPVTQFYLLRVFQNGGSYIWYYACGISCLRYLIQEKILGEGKFLLREYMTTCGKAWKFNSRDELKAFIDQLK